MRRREAAIGRIAYHGSAAPWMNFRSSTAPSYGTESPTTRSGPRRAILGSTAEAPLNGAYEVQRVLGYGGRSSLGLGHLRRAGALGTGVIGYGLVPLGAPCEDHRGSTHGASGFQSRRSLAFGETLGCAALGVGSVSPREAATGRGPAGGGDTSGGDDYDDDDDNEEEEGEEEAQGKIVADRKRALLRENPEVWREVVNFLDDSGDEGDAARREARAGGEAGSGPRPIARRRKREREKPTGMSPAGQDGVAARSKRQCKQRSKKSDAIACGEEVLFLGMRNKHSAIESAKIRWLKGEPTLMLGKVVTFDGVEGGRYEVELHGEAGKTVRVPSKFVTRLVDVSRFLRVGDNVLSVPPGQSFFVYGRVIGFTPLGPSGRLAKVIFYDDEVNEGGVLLPAMHVLPGTGELMAGTLTAAETLYQRCPRQ